MIVLIGIPVYGGICYADFMMSLINLTKALEHHKIKYELHIVQNESLITRARNGIVAKFMENINYSHLLFLDSDLMFEAETILTMLKEKKEIVGASYPKKSLNLDKMLHYYDKGVEKDQLLYRQTDMNYNLKIYNKTQAKVDGACVETLDVPTGMMLIDKRAMSQVIHKNRDFKYKNNVAGYNDKSTFYDIFRVGVNSKGYYLSEDYYFCELARECGIKLWLMANATLVHIGRYNYHGNLGTVLADNTGERFDADSVLVNN